MESGIKDFWIKDKSVLVTGASGFIGSALTEALITLGARVFVLSQTVDIRRPLYGSGSDPRNRPLAWDVEKIIHGDLRHRTDLFHAVSISEPDFVFHLGALTQVTEAARDPINTFKVNALGTLHLLEACRQIAPDSKIVIASSDKAYGKPTTHRVPLFEPERLRPVHPYDVSKAAADMLSLAHAKYYGAQIQVARMANVYGPGDTNWKRLIPGVCRWIIEGNQPIIRSDGKQVRQYLYIDDAVAAYIALAAFMVDGKRTYKGRAWNFGPRDKHSVLEIVGAISDIARKRGIDVLEPLILDEARDETESLVMNSDRAKRLLGWYATHPFDVWLPFAFDFIKDYLRGKGF
jgi:CDP-glucose 4,6-dehydratase